MNLVASIIFIGMPAITLALHYTLKSLGCLEGFEEDRKLLEEARKNNLQH